MRRSVSSWRSITTGADRSHPATVIADVRTLVAGAPNRPPSRPTASGSSAGWSGWSATSMLLANASSERSRSCRPSGDQSRLAHALIEKGWICFLRGDDDEATSCSNAALECAHALSDDALLADCEAAAGTLQSRSGDAAACIEHLEHALAYFERVSDEGAYANALLNIAAVEVDRPDPDLDRVTTCARRALEIFEKRKDGAPPRTRCGTWRWPVREGRVDEALAMFPDAVSLSHRHGNITDVPWTLVEFACPDGRGGAHEDR